MKLRIVYHHYLFSPFQYMKIDMMNYWRIRMQIWSFNSSIVLHFIIENCELVCFCGSFVMFVSFGNVVCVRCESLWVHLVCQVWLSVVIIHVDHVMHWLWTLVGVIHGCRLGFDQTTLNIFLLFDHFIFLFVWRHFH